MERLNLQKPRKVEFITDIEDGGILRIKNAAKRINKKIYLVGSRARGNYNIGSDFDYIIPNLRSRDWCKIKNSLPGAKSYKYNLTNRIDLLKADVDFNRPHIEVSP